MKKISLLFVAFMLLGLTMKAQTNVGGTLKGNLNWTSSGSPYNITSNVGVPPGVILTIEPGVTVNFNSNSQLIVQGSIIINGNIDAPIIFNGNNLGVAMLLFQKTNLTKSTLSYIIINGLRDGIKLSNNNSDNNNGTLTINNLSITNSKIETNGYDSNAILTINNSTITNTKIYGNPPRSEKIYINDSNITEGAIISYAYNNGIYVNSSTTKNVNFEIGCCNGNVNIVGGSVDNCNFLQESISQAGSNNILNIDGVHLNNSFINMPVSTVNIQNSIFSYTSNYSKPSCIVSGNGIINKSQFTGKGSLIAIERGPSSYNYDNNNAYIITNSTFKGFETNIKINAGTQTNSGNGAVSVNNCDFLDSPTNFIINNNSPYDMSAKSNWWGSVVISEIENSIYDYWDNLADGKVIYSNFLTSQTNAPLSIQTINNSGNSFSVFPNPFSNETTLKANNNFENANLEIYNTFGQVVKNIQHISGESIKLNRDNLPVGVYFIQINQDNKTIMKGKLVITN
jgi:hypothetical protein